MKVAQNVLQVEGWFAIEFGFPVRCFCNHNVESGSQLAISNASQPIAFNQNEEDLSGFNLSVASENVQES